MCMSQKTERLVGSQFEWSVQLINTTQAMGTRFVLGVLTYNNRKADLMPRKQNDFVSVRTVTQSK